MDSNDDDLLIIALIEAATDHAETFTRRALVSRGLLYLDAFPRPGNRPASSALSAVSSVKYYDEDGTLQTLSTAAYTVDTRSTPGPRRPQRRLRLARHAGQTNAVEVALHRRLWQFAKPCPKASRLAVQYILRHWFDNRGWSPPPPCAPSQHCRSPALAIPHPKLA